MKLTKRFSGKVLIGSFVMMLVSGFVWTEVAIAEKLWTEGPDTSPSEEVIIGGSLFRRLAEKLSPGVVSIRSMQKVPSRLYGDFPFGLPPGSTPPSPPNEFQQRGEGSGFIIQKEGYILTNAHVVVGSDEVQVALSDGKLFKGHLIGLDRKEVGHAGAGPGLPEGGEHDDKMPAASYPLAEGLLGVAGYRRVVGFAAAA